VGHQRTTSSTFSERRCTSTFQIPHSTRCPVCHCHCHCHSSRSKDRQGCAHFHHIARNGPRIALFCCVEEARLLRTRVPYSLDAIGGEDGEQLLRSCRRCKVSQLSRSQVWAVLLRNCKPGSWSSWSSKTRVPTLPRTYSYSCQRTCVDVMTERSPCSYRILNF